MELLFACCLLRGLKQHTALIQLKIEKLSVSIIIEISTFYATNKFLYQNLNDLAKPQTSEIFVLKLPWVDQTKTNGYTFYTDAI
jgi:hypothetical protein